MGVFFLSSKCFSDLIISTIIAISTNTTLLTTITTPACNSTGRGTFMSISGLNPNTWTQYQLNYTATKTTPTIMFGFQNANNRTYYLDTVSIVNINAPSTQLLTNPSFESSSTSATGWTQWCTSTCGSSPGTITSGSTCNLGTGNCYADACDANVGIDFLAQSFTTSIGSFYTISFWLVSGGAGTGTTNTFYVDII